MAQNMTKAEYNDYVKKKSPNTTLFKNMANAFWVGGVICVIGQGIKALLLARGLGEMASAALTSAALIFLGALLTGLNVYDQIAKHAGAGTLVPITGFANSIVAPAMEFKSEGYIMGIGTKMFAIAGPVLVYGVVSSVVVGIIYFVFRG